MKLSGKVAIVTGGGGGMAAGISTALAEEGCDVALLDINVEAAEKVAVAARALGRKSMVVGCDVTKHLDVQAAIGKVYAQFGHVDILVNNAGYGQYILVKDMTEEMWDRMIAVHLKGTFSCTKAVIDKMIAQGSGRIINISSVSGMMGAPTHSHYAAAKAGMIGFTKGLAKELAAHQITVNAVAPGIVETPFIGRMNPDLKEKVIASTLLGRLGRPRDIAAVVAFLATEDAGFITGQVISPNGGLLI